MSTPIPSPSMNGMIGLSGVGSPGTILVAVRRNLDVRRRAHSPTVCSWQGRHATEPRRGRGASIAAVLIEGFDRHYRLFRATSAQAKERFERGGLGRGAAGGAGADPLLRRARPRVRRPAARASSTLDALDATRPGGRPSSTTSGCSSTTSQPELAETFFNSVITRILRRTYSDNDLIFVRAAISTEYIESDPPIYRSYYPDVDGERDCFAPRLPRLRLEPARSPISTRDLDRVLARSRSARRAVDAPRAEPPDPGAPLGLLPQQGRLRVRQGRQRPRRAAVRRPGPARRPTAGSSSTRSLLDEQQINVLFSLSRAYFMVDMEVPSGYVEFLRSMTPTQARAPSSTRCSGSASRARRSSTATCSSTCTTPRDAFVEAPGIRGQVMLVFTLPSYPVRLQGDPGRVRPRQGHRPRDRALEVRDGEARRPRRAHGRHARVHRPGAAARPLLAGAARAAARRSRRR